MSFVCYVHMSFSGETLYYNSHVGPENPKRKRRLLVVTDETEKMQLLWYCHTTGPSAHSGINATQQKVALTHYWHGIKEDVRRFVSIVF